MGMAPLRPRWYSQHTSSIGKTVFGPHPKPVFAAAAWCDATNPGTGASWHHMHQADMERLAATAASAQPDFREPDPRSVAEALSRPDSAEWQRAIDEEIASCLQFGVWEECDLPPGKQALPSRVILERKRNGRYKARLVAGGHRQQYGLDFEDTYAPVCSYRTMRMVLATAAHEDLEMRQFDIQGGVFLAIHRKMATFTKC